MSAFQATIGGRFASRRRNHDRHPDFNLQQDLEDMGMADHFDSFPSYHNSQRKATCSCASTTEQSASSAILVRSCLSSKTDSSHKQKRSLQKSKQASEPEGSPQNKFSISGSYEEIQHQRQHHTSYRNLCDKAQSAAHFSGSTGEWFRATVPTVFYIHV